MEKSIEDLVKDEKLVSRILSVLNDAFPNIFYKYNKTWRDAYSFYLYGHCATFARILYEIFDGNVTIMDSNSHVVVKIGDLIYDVRGCVNDQINKDEYRDCPIEYFGFVEMLFTKPDDHDKEIANDLIQRGKKEIQDLRYGNKSEYKTL